MLSLVLGTDFGFRRGGHVEELGMNSGISIMIRAALMVQTSKDSTRLESNRRIRRTVESEPQVITQNLQCMEEICKPRTAG
jgi:hypothetical protein